MTDDGWIIVPNWGRFQHYKDRNPAWIKLYLELGSKDEWRQLTFAERGLLVDIWVEYALSGGLIRVKDLPNRVGIRPHYKHLMRHLESLNHAGFIEVSASKPLALRALAREEELRSSSQEGASAHAERAKRVRATAPDKNRDPAEALAEAHDLAAGWTGQDTDEFETALDRIARKHGVRISYLERVQLWDIAFGS